MKVSNESEALERIGNKLATGGAVINQTFDFEIIKQALTELETLQKKYKLADDVLADIGETLVDVSKWHITENKAIEEIRKYTSAYHNKN